MRHGDSSTPIPREAVLVLLCCRPAGTAAGSIRALLRETLDWERVLALSLRWQTVPLLYERLRTAGFEGVPPRAVRALRQWQLGSCRTSLLLTGKLLAVLEALGTRNIRTLPYKGPVLAQSAYGSLVLRPFGDLDLLLAPADLDPAREALEALGWRPSLALTPRQERARRRHADECELEGADGTRVELHWQLHPRLQSGSPDFEALWRRRATVSLAGRCIPSLSPEDHLLVLCLHGAKHLWQPLRLVVDLSQLLAASPELDWGALRRRAARMRAVRTLRVGLLLAGDLLQTPLPPSVEQWVRADPEAGRLARRITDRLLCGDEIPSTPGARFLFTLRIQERWRDRARYAWSALLVPGEQDWQRWRFPDWLYPLYGLARPFRLAGRCRPRRFPAGAPLPQPREALPASRPPD